MGAQGDHDQQADTQSPLGHALPPATVDDRYATETDGAATVDEAEVDPYSVALHELLGWPIPRRKVAPRKASATGLQPNGAVETQPKAQAAAADLQTNQQLAAWLSQQLADAQSPTAALLAAALVPLLAAQRGEQEPILRPVLPTLMRTVARWAVQIGQQCDMIAVIESVFDRLVTLHRQRRPVTPAVANSLLKRRLRPMRVGDSQVSQTTQLGTSSAGRKTKRQPPAERNWWDDEDNS